MNHFFSDEFPPAKPPPELQRAVKIALRLFAEACIPACPDRREWRRDCEQEAWLAVLKAAPRYRCPDPPPANPERHFVLWLAGKALKHLRQHHAREADYYECTVPMVIQNEEGEEEELEFVDEGAHAQVEAVLEWVLLAQVLEQLSPYLDEKDWAIIEGLLVGKRQDEIAQELEMSQQAVSKRLGKIRRLARGILEESG